MPKSSTARLSPRSFRARRLDDGAAQIRHDGAFGDLEDEPSRVNCARLEHSAHAIRERGVGDLARRHVHVDEEVLRWRVPARPIH